MGPIIQTNSIKAKLIGAGSWEIFSRHDVLLPSDAISTNCGSVYQYSRAMDLNRNRKNRERILQILLLEFG